MATTTQDPTVGSWTPINMWAMLRALINNNCPTLTIDGTAFPVTSGTSGTYAGQAGPGSSLIDYKNGVIYCNTGTILSPIWTVDVGAVSGPQGQGSVQNAKMTYSFAVSGGATSTITPVGSPILPLGAIVQGGFIDVTTIPVGVGASIGLGFGSGSQVAALLAPAAISGVPWSSTGLKAIIPIYTAATMYKLTASAAMTATISAVALTAGIFDVNIVYTVGN
jgi:hypothetical protein